MKQIKKVSTMCLFIISSILMMCGWIQAQEPTGIQVSRQVSMDDPLHPVDVDQAIYQARKFLQEKGYPIHDYVITQFLTFSKFAPEWTLWFKNSATIGYLIVTGSSDPTKPLSLAITSEDGAQDSKTWKPTMSIDSVISEARKEVVVRYPLNDYFISQISYFNRPYDLLSFIKMKFFPKSFEGRWIVSFQKYSPTDYLDVEVNDKTKKITILKR